MTEIMVDAVVHVRWMIRRDMDEVLKIENECFEQPWSEAEFAAELRERNVIAKVAEVCELVAGFALYELHRDRIELLNFAIRADVQRRGIGTALVDNLKDRLHPARRRKIVTHVRESNLAGHLFFRENGFRCTRMEANFYRDSTEDAYRFEFLCREGCLGK